MAQFYIDTSSTGTGDGTTIATTGANAAWAAFSEITGEAAGDTISLNKGDTWREMLTVATAGSDGLPITFNAYGTGADPIIHGAALRESWTAVTDHGLPATNADIEVTMDANMSEWTSQATDGGKLSWNASAAMGGASGGGMQCLMDGDADRKYTTKAISWSTSVIRGRFYFDPNGFTTTDAEDIISLVSFSLAGTERGGIRYKVTSGGAHSVAAVTKNDATADAATSYYVITDAAHYIEWEINRATSAVASDGTLQLWIDGVSQETVTGIDIDGVSRPTTLRGGAGCNSDEVPSANSSGTFYLDEFAMNYDGDALGAVVLQTNLSYATLAADPVCVVQGGTFQEEITTGIDDLTADTWYWSAGNTRFYYKTDGTAIASLTIETFGRANCVSSTNLDYLTFDGIHFKGPSQYNGIYLPEGGEGVIVQNCTFGNFNARAIESTGGAGDDLSITISINTFSDAGNLYPIYLHPNAGATNAATISSNTFTCTFFDGTSTTLPASNLMKAIQASDIDTCTIGSNTITFPDVLGDTSTILCDGCPDPTVESNTITGGNHGITFNDASSGGIIRYNKITSSYDDGIWVYGTSTGTQIYYNIVDGAADDGIDIDSAPNCTIYNNVMANCIDTGLVLRDTSTGVTVKNNIFYENGQPGTPVTGDEGGHEISVTANSQTNFTSDYNYFYHTTAKVTNTEFDWGGSSYSFANWKTQSSQDANSADADPVMTDPANDDFTLQTTSPCINAGVDVSLTVDYSGEAVAPPPDIGAYETDISSMGGGLGMNMFMGMGLK